MAPGSLLRPITNGLQQDHRGIRPVGDAAPVARPLPLPSSAEAIVKLSHPQYSRALAWALALLAVACSALAAAPETRAAQGVETVVCWKRLLNDWYDGRIDNAYPVRCYREAIANLPDDVKVYADAEADIRRALLAALLENKKATGKQATPATPVKPPSKPRTNPAPSQGDEEQEAAPTAGPGQGKPPFDGTLPTGATRSADSVPLPLIVLAALAMLLLAAAGAGVVARRLQARRIPAAVPPAEESSPLA
jgi:hypothetical protein